MRDRRGLRRAVVGALIVTAVLSGCSEKQEANETLPTSTPTETASDLPPLGPEDMPMPDEARTQHAAGAEAFVRYYFDLLNHSLSTMDPHYLRLFANDGCDVCTRIAQETEDDAAKGYSYEGGELTISGDVSVVLIRPEESQSAFVADQAAMTILDSTGAPVSGLTFDRKNGLSSGSIATWDGALRSWTMTELTLG